MVRLSSHKTPIDISGDVFILGYMWIWLSFLIGPGIWSVAMFDYSIVFPSGSLAVIPFEIMTGAIVVLACFSSCIFSP